MRMYRRIEGSRGSSGQKLKRRGKYKHRTAGMIYVWSDVTSLLCGLKSLFLVTEVSGMSKTTTHGEDGKWFH